MHVDVGSWDVMNVPSKTQQMQLAKGKFPIICQYWCI